jgi:FkbM family methyltransferase
MIAGKKVGKFLKSLLSSPKALIKKNPEKYLKKIRGLIHVGANTGQERQLYSKYKLSVIWVEPIPEIFAELENNLIGISKQVAIKGLVTDRDNEEYTFKVASNHGASSSIFDFDLHKDIWPNITFEKTISLYSKTLPTLLIENNIEIGNYDMLVIDTQGSELLVLKGAVSILQNFKYIQTEVPDFEAYKGCCQLEEVQFFFKEQNYEEVFRKKFAKHPDSGTYYDIIFKKIGEKLR